MADLKDNEVIITKERLEELEADERFLSALRAAGVDNWGGYSDAYDIMREMYPDHSDD